MDYSDISTILSDQITISDFLACESKDKTVEEIYTGLSAKQKYISSKFFYDENGSSLFEKITTLPEYYPTRTEKAILNKIAPEIMGLHKNTDIIELGSGDCSKISILLDAVPKPDIKNVRYFPVDVSEAAILKSADILSFKYPEIRIHGFLADFMKHLEKLPGKENRLICFFGSTIGNLSKWQAMGFLMNLKSLMHPGDCLLLGLDRVKESEILEDAYNDKQGITAAFNKNILRVVNKYSGTNFDLRLFEHKAFYNAEKARIEMHLIAVQNMKITSALFPEKIFLKKGETIHTENSHKYTSMDIQNIISITGLKVENIFSDANQWFSLVQFKCID